MRFLEKIQTIERIDQLIRMKATGSARDLAKKIGVSKSTLYEILETMKLMGAHIKYSSSKKSYYYETDKILAIGFVNPSKITGNSSLNNNLGNPAFLDNSPII